MKSFNSQHYVISDATQITLDSLYATQRRANQQQAGQAAKKEVYNHELRIANLLETYSKGEPCFDDKTAETKTIASLPITSRLGQGSSRPTQEDARSCGAIAHVKLRTEEDVLTVAHALFKADINLAKLTDNNEDGSTKTSCVIMTLDTGEQYILTSNCGDSGAYVAYQIGDAAFTVEPLGILHNPSTTDEITRIKATKDAWIAPNGRLNGQILVSRSFGDKALRPGLIPAPEYSLFKVPAEAINVVLIAFSDGLSDVISAKDFARILPDLQKFQNPASVLGCIAYDLFPNDNSSLEWVDVDKCPPGSLLYVSDCDGHAGRAVSNKLALEFGGEFIFQLLKSSPQCRFLIDDVECPDNDHQVIDSAEVFPLKETSDIAPLSETEGSSTRELYNMICSLAQTPNSSFQNDELNDDDYRFFQKHIVNSVNNILFTGQATKLLAEKQAQLLRQGFNPQQYHFITLLQFINGLAKYVDFRATNLDAAEIIAFSLAFDRFCPLTQHRNIQAYLLSDNVPAQARQHYQAYLEGSTNSPLVNRDASTNGELTNIQSKKITIYEKALKPLQIHSVDVSLRTPILNFCVHHRQQKSMQTNSDKPMRLGEFIKLVEHNAMEVAKSEAEMQRLIPPAVTEQNELNNATGLTHTLNH